MTMREVSSVPPTATDDNQLFEPSSDPDSSGSNHTSLEPWEVKQESNLIDLQPDYQQDTNAQSVTANGQRSTTNYW